MTKIVINRRYGGLELSNEAIEQWGKRKGITLTPQYYNYTTKKDAICFYTFEDDENNIRILVPDEHIRRDDEALVETITELGEYANTEVSELTVIEVPDDVEWSIIRKNFDAEIIVEKGRVWF